MQKELYHTKNKVLKKMFKILTEEPLAPDSIISCKLLKGKCFIRPFGMHTLKREKKM